MTDYKYYWEVLSRIKRPIFSITTNQIPNMSTLSLESYMSYGLGSCPAGRVLSHVPCTNTSSQGSRTSPCSNDGLLGCSQCSLVKYCSGRCQRQHWSKHSLDCEHPLLSSEWQPDWITENRLPLFTNSRSLQSSSSIEVYKNTGHLPYDCLQLPHNEGTNSLGQNFKICFTAASDIRNLIETINSLPAGYSGRIDVLLNNSNAIVLNRMLVVLCTLLSPGPSIEESAELAMHLMYSANLPETGANYMRHCVNVIYGQELNDGEMSFQTTLKTRGRGKLYSAQPAASIKRPLGMFSSTYGLAKANENLHGTLQNPLRIDDKHRVLATLRPAHRLALCRFWKTGVLAPFSLDLAHFKHPNRLMFTPQGEWLGGNCDISPLHGWDISAISRAGVKHGLDPTGDVLGCLFFYIKAELREFSTRIKELNVNIHLLQYDSRLLSKGISIGVLPAFSDASFDRVDLGDMTDQIGVAECLADWGPLLNKQNKDACVLMHSKRWHEDMPGAIARDNPRTLQMLMERCESVPSLNAKLKNLFMRPQTPSLVQLMSSLDAFVDHEEAFSQYLRTQEAEATGASLGLRLRQTNHVHSKRVGIPLHATCQKLPNLSKDEFYDLFTIGGADLAVRFAEFEIASFAI
ncbi:hypothetical protein B0H34DRAFT_705229 [Crassisporium funariophilum]|nr:hypothetical protein B0H34DRAFT_705229 [Crassisporium funariophilum]